MRKARQQNQFQLIRIRNKECFQRIFRGSQNQEKTTKPALGIDRNQGLSRG